MADKNAIQMRYVGGQRAGFTMIEMLIALSIFSMLSLVAYQLLTSTSSVTQRLHKSNEQYRLSSRALDIIERDLRQIIARPVRGSAGAIKRLPALRAGEQSGGSSLAQLGSGANDADSAMLKSLLEFSRGGYVDVPAIAYGSVVRVQYQIDEVSTDLQSPNADTLGKAEVLDRVLIRKIYKTLDAPSDSQPLRQQLLANIMDVSFHFYDDKQRRHTSWPPVKLGRKKRPSNRQQSGSDSNADANADNGASVANVFEQSEYELPYSVEITIFSNSGNNNSRDEGISRVVSLR